MTYPLAELETRFDGPIPKHLRDAARRGVRPLDHAQADLRVWNRFVHGRDSSIRRYRGAPPAGAIGCLRIVLAKGTIYRVGEARYDLAYYRRHRKGALRRLIRQRQAAEREAIRPVTHSLGSLSVDRAVALACQAPEDAA